MTASWFNTVRKRLVNADELPLPFMFSFKESEHRQLCRISDKIALPTSAILRGEPLDRANWGQQ